MQRGRLVSRGWVDEVESTAVMSVVRLAREEGRTVWIGTDK